jgi:sec-independent protein translocase protein TatA
MGVMELLLIGGGILLFFGAKKIPTLARGLGEGIRNFKGEMTGRAAGDEQDAPKKLDAGAPKKLKDSDGGAKRREP